MQDNSEESDEPRFTITLKPETAWFIRGNLLLGPRPSVPIPYQADVEMTYSLRAAINDAIVAFSSNSEAKSFEIAINESQAFIIDQMLKANVEGDYKKLAMQVIRGLWGLQHGLSDSNLSTKTAKDPWEWLSKGAGRALLDKLE